MSKKPSPKSLPRIKKAELDKKTKLEEGRGMVSQEREGTMWIIVFALAILIVFAILVWAFFSNRSASNSGNDNAESGDASETVEEWGELEYVKD